MKYIGKPRIVIALLVFSMFLGTASASISSCPSANQMDVLVSYSFSQLGISECSGLGETPAYWNSYCSSTYPSDRPVYACCSNSGSASCYSLKSTAPIPSSTPHILPDKSTLQEPASNPASNIESCPSELYYEYLNVPISYTLDYLEKSSCSELGGDSGTWNEFCRSETGTTDMHACCSDDLRVAACYNYKHPEDLDSNLAYNVLTSVAKGQGGIRSCDSVTNADYKSTAFSMTGMGVGCSGLDGHFFLWDKKCQTESGNAAKYACCSDLRGEVRCYDYKVPTNLVFEYVEDTVGQGGSVHYKYSADNANHYEAQSLSQSGLWSSWTNIGTVPCPVACMGEEVGEPGVHKMRVRACGGPELGEACTGPIEDSFVTSGSGETQPANPTQATTLTGQAIDRCPSEFDEYLVHVPIYKTFNDLGISSCDDIGESPGYWNNYCHDNYGDADNHACCSESLGLVGCYSYSTPSDFVFIIPDPMLLDTGELFYEHYARYANHYEVQISVNSSPWSNWQDIDAYLCKSPCAMDGVPPAVWDVRMRACAGPGLGEVCTQPVLQTFYTMDDSWPDTFAAPYSGPTIFGEGPTGQAIESCPSEFDENLVTIPEYKTFNDLGITSCNDIGESPGYWNNYCHDTNPGLDGNEHACCSETLQMLGCYSYRKPTGLIFNIMDDSVPVGGSFGFEYAADNANHYEAQLYESGSWSDWQNIGTSDCKTTCSGVADGPPGLRSARVRACAGPGLGEACTDSIEHMFTVVEAEKAIDRCPELDANIVNVLVYYTFDELEISTCDDIGESPSYWDNYCHDNYPGGNGNEKACCSETDRMLGCYSYHLPSLFDFHYLNDTTYIGGTISYAYHAENANHYEVQSMDSMGLWSEWQILGASDCQAGCTGSIVGSPGTHTVRFRACAGIGLGEACTDPIEDSFVTLEEAPETQGTVSGFSFHFVEHNVNPGEEVHAIFSADNVNHYEIRYYNDPVNPMLGEPAGWTQWLNASFEGNFADSCTSGCSFGVYSNGTHKHQMRACMGPGFGESCTTAQEDYFVVGESHDTSSESQTANNGTGDCSSFTVSNEGDDFESLYKYINPPIEGFRDLYNPNIISGIDDEHNPGHKLMYVGINIVNGPRLGAANPGSPSVSKFPDKFKIFIPPGTRAIYGVTIYYPINVDEGIIIRYQQVPDALYMSYAWDPDGWKYMSWDWEEELYLETAITRDMYNSNSGGHAKALSGQGFSTIKTVKDSGWLYLQKIPFSSDTIDTVDALIEVDYDAYKEWYNKVKPCTDTNQDSSAGYCWDESGDPVSLAGCPD